MQTAATNRFLLTSSSSLKRSNLKNVIKQGGFYQQIFRLAKDAYKTDALCNIGNSLLAVAEHAYTLREMNTVEEVAELTTALPLPRGYERAAQYYKALCVRSRGEIAEAVSLLERVAEDAPPYYRARAMQSIGTVLVWNTPDKQTASKVLTEACYFARRHAGDVFTLVNSRWVLAVIKSFEGDHQGALDDLESLFPLVRAVAMTHPLTYYGFMNSLAVEMGEVGRLEEALNASRIALSSPFGGAYFEWSETRNELLLKARRSSKSKIAISRTVASPENVVSLPAPQQNLGGLTKYETPFPQQARVLRFRGYMTMAKEVNDARDSSSGLQTSAIAREAKLEDLRRMTTRQKLLRIMELMSDDKITDDQLLNVLLILEDVFPEQRRGN